LERFLNDSALAEKVKLVPRIVVQRASLTPRELLEIRRAGNFGPVPEKEQICELEVGGVVLARGKIISRRGKVYFRTLQSVESEAKT
jgi:hypothetical protein